MKMQTVWLCLDLMWLYMGILMMSCDHVIYLPILRRVGLLTLGQSYGDLVEITLKDLVQLDR